ncbi:UDP-N-acetyl-D-mannosamine dehydrogenase [Gammaproteobacteria bacterium]|nr:UDP-N-acetyl-D-mannosamine dehydrogenase [Gammaproteobacteria bacterium]
MMFNKITVVGLGYIGLPTAAMFASKKIEVIGVDKNKATVDIVNTGKVHIVEPELEDIVYKAVNNNYLKASLKPVPADAFIIAVPTPFKKNSSKTTIPEPDLSYIKSAAIDIAKVLKSGDLIILESTSPVGTTEKLSTWLSEHRKDLTFPLSHGENSDIRIAYCPERVLPGKIISELVSNDRVIGGISKNCSVAASNLYKTFVKGKCIDTNSRTAEMVKLSENAYRDINIAYANELSILCDEHNIKTTELISLANRHPRVNILNPGPGVGGHCIAVDPWFLAHASTQNSNLIQAARHVNDYKKEWVIKKIIEKVASLKTIKPKIGILGLSFKPDIDDLRESPAHDIARTLAGKGFNVMPVEPNVSSVEEMKLFDLKDVMKDADIIIKLVSHSQFRNLNLNEAKLLNFVEEIN